MRYACRSQVKGFYSDQGGSDRKLRGTLCLDSSEASVSQLNDFVGKVKRGEWDNGIYEAPFLFNAFEQMDALHVVFGAGLVNHIMYVKSVKHIQFVHANTRCVHVQAEIVWRLSDVVHL